MSDRTLLEDAARAAGYTAVRPMKSRPGRWMAQISGDWTEWSPLIDDGAEARLEAELQMHVAWQPAMKTVSVGTAAVDCTEPYGKDRQAARRRAGVRAAASIGRLPGEG